VNILLVHNYYLQPGGEDVAFRTEADLLRRYGHTVTLFEEHNTRVADIHPLSMAIKTIWSEATRRRLLSVLDLEQPDIVHFQNTFPLISPSAYYACHQAGASVVQTLQNYRLLCPVAIFYRDGHVCEDCLGKPLPWPGIVHACYHNSHIHSGVVAGMLATHRILRTWHREVDAYIALTNFARDTFIEGGLPSRKIFLKPNLTSFISRAPSESREYALFVGRLSEEKGIRTLLSAWGSLSIPLKIAGDGPMRNYLLQELDRLNLPTIDYLGSVPHQELETWMSNARILVFPSTWYEGFPLTIAEAFACYLPVITSNIGSQAEIVRNEYSGLHFRVGDAADLAEKVKWCFEHPQSVLRMGRNARQEYEEKYTPEINYQQLMNIYSQALANRV
jgi:glycosyltransferase involved in cell wall biosynthesis